MMKFPVSILLTEVEIHVHLVPYYLLLLLKKQPYIEVINCFPSDDDCGFLTL